VTVSDANKKLKFLNEVRPTFCLQLKVGTVLLPIQYDGLTAEL